MSTTCKLQEQVQSKTEVMLCNAVQVDLPAQLSVDLVHCERAAQQAVAESNGGLRLLQAELFTTAYFDNLAAEVNEVLQVCCCIQLGLSSFGLYSQRMIGWVTACIVNTTTRQMWSCMCLHAL